MGEVRRSLVTGGAGFIGSHLVERLVRDGDSVSVLDNLSTGRMENLEAVRDNPRLKVHAVDIVDITGIRALFEGVHHVYHLAALADIVPSIERPLDYHQTNVEGTAAVMEAARRAGVGKVVYAASSSCYGIPELHPTPEHAPLDPRYPYALTKVLGEQIALHWGRVYGIPVVSLRLFNVYGPRSRTSGSYGAVFGVFLAQKLAQKPFTVVGDGSQTRDFTFVTDVVDALVLAARSPVQGEVMNVGSGEPQSVNRIVELLGGEAVTLPRRPGEPDRTQADTTRIRRLLGWQTRTDFAEGLEILLDNIEYWRSAPVWDPSSISEATRSWFATLGNSPRAA